MQLLNTDAVARRFAESGIEIDRDEIARLARNGAFPNSAIKTKGKWYISLAEVDEYISCNPPSDQPTTQLIRKQKVYVSDIATQLGISVDKARELCKYGYFKGAYQLWENGPWQITQDAVESLAKRVENLERIPTIWDRVRYWIVTNQGKSVVAALITITGLFFGAISAGADIGGARSQLVEWGLLREFSPARDGEVLIVIAEFYRTEMVADTDIHNEIRKAILKTAQEYGVPDLRVEVEPRRLRADDLEKAQSVLERYGADVVIWGEDTGVRVTVSQLSSPSYLALTTPRAIIETERTQLQDPVNYAKFVTSDLPAHMTFISLFATGQVAQTNGNAEKAKQIITQAIENAGPKATLEGIAYAYFTLGDLYLSGGVVPQELITTTELVFGPPESSEQSVPLNLSPEELEKAISYYSMVESLAPNGFINSGKIFYYRAIAYMLSGNADLALSDFIEFEERINPGHDPVVGAHRNRGVYASAVGDYDLAVHDLSYVVNAEREIDCSLAADLMHAHYNRAHSTLSDSGDVIIENAGSVEVEGALEPIQFVIIRGQDLNSEELLDDFTYVIELSESGYCLDDPLITIGFGIPDMVKYSYFFRGFVYWLIKQDEEALVDYKHYAELEEPENLLAPYDLAHKLNVDSFQTDAEDK